MLNLPRFPSLFESNIYVHVFDAQIHVIGCCKKVQRGYLPVLMGPLSWHMQRKKDTKGHRVFAYIINVRLRGDIIKKKPFYEHKTESYMKML